MANSSSFGVTIKAIDQASGTIDRINKNLAKMRQPVDKLQASIRKFSNLSGVTDMMRGFEKLSSSIENAMFSVLKFIPVLGTLIGAGMIDGLYKLVEAAGQMGTALINSSKRIGVTVGNLASLQGAARLASVPVEAVAGSLEGLSDAIRDAKQGANPDFMRLLIGQNIDYNKPVDQVLRQLLEKAKQFSPEWQRKLFDVAHIDKSLMPLIGTLQELEERTHKFNPLTDAAAEALKKMNSAGLDVKEAMMGLGNELAIRLAPILTPLLEQFANWIAKNREWLATKIIEGVKAFYEWTVKTIPKIQEWIDKWNGLKTIGEALVVLWGVRMVAAVGSFALALARIVPPAWLMTLLSPAGLAAIATLGMLKLGSDNDPGKGVSDPLHDLNNQRRSPNGGPNGPTFDGYGPDGKPTSIASGTGLSADERALADVIGQAEGTGTDYARRNGIGRWDITKPHPGPGDIGPAGTSTATGRFQFVLKTWNKLMDELNMPRNSPMSEANQNIAFKQDLLDHGITASMLADPRQRASILKTLAPEWDSLPDAGHPQANLNTMLKRWDVYSNLERDRAKPIEAGNSDILPGPRADKVGPDGKIMVEVKHTGAPAGTGLNVQTWGDMWHPSSSLPLPWNNGPS